MRIFLSVDPWVMNGEYIGVWSAMGYRR